MHRALIRAQLPRIEGHKEERRLPDFTIRQNSGRGVNSHFRGGDARMKAARRRRARAAAPDNGTAAIVRTAGRALPVRARPALPDGEAPDVAARRGSAAPGAHRGRAAAAAANARDRSRLSAPAWLWAPGSGPVSMSDSNHDARTSNTPKAQSPKP